MGHAPPDVFANNPGVARHGAAARPDPGSPGLVVRTGEKGRYRFEPELLPRNFPGGLLGCVDADDTGGGDAPAVGWSHALNLLDVRRCGFRCVLYGSVDNRLDGRTDSRRH